jgi:hypothetical protein
VTTGQRFQLYRQESHCVVFDACFLSGWEHPNRFFSVQAWNDRDLRGLLLGVFLFSLFPVYPSPIVGFEDTNDLSRADLGFNLMITDGLCTGMHRSSQVTPRD